MADSNKDIARQFELPERQSKIATLLKQNDVYCICRSTDSTRFMIACDNCEEWFHGDCIDITEQDAKHIKKYFCERCQLENPSLKVVHKSKKAPLHPTNKDRGGREKLSERRGRPGRPKKSETKEYRLKEPKEPKEHQSKEPRTKEPKLKEPRLKESRSRGEGRHRKEERHSHVSTSTSVKKHNKRAWNPPSDESEEDDSGDSDFRQCYGPTCTQEALSGSKYCSDNCGIQLAYARIYRVLPSRVHEWSLTPSKAEQRNRRDLEEIRAKQVNCRRTIEELEKRRKKLDDHITNVQKLRLLPDEEEIEPDEEGTTYCITCGHEISMKTCFKHMEKCYNKYESQTSFASVAKTNVEGIPIFCDAFNPSNNTYCKRLKVLCPEHSKEPKVKDNELCGCPLVKDVWDEKSDSFSKPCRILKKKCNRHFSWEKIQRSLLDMERVRQWLKYDELLDAERTLRQALTNRAGVLGLLLHSTYDYDAVPPT